MSKKAKKTTTTVIDTDQLGYHYDTIQCPTCGTVQTARVVDTHPQPTYLHKCQACGWVIEGDEWNSVVPI